MIIYDKQPEYCPYTGDAVGYQFVEKERRCDFSGQLLSDGGQGSDPVVSYVLEYDSTDAGYGTVAGEHELRMEHHVEDHHFMSEDPFEIRWDKSEQLKKRFIQSSEHTFDRFLRECRASTTIRLLEEGVVESWQLAGGPEPE